VKKLFCVIFVFMLLVPTALADELLFRSIPWGTSISDVDKSLDLDYFFIHEEQNMRRWGSIEQQFDFEHINDYPAGWYGYSLGIEDLKVAGYNALPTIYCAYGLTDDGVILREAEDSIFYAGGYAFAVIDHEATYYDLKNKLESLYGIGEETVNEGKSYYASVNGNGEYAYKTYTVVWRGDNETEIKLYCMLSELNDPLLDENNVVLWYGKANMDAYLDELQTVIHQEKLQNEEKNRNHDLSGL